MCVAVLIFAWQGAECNLLSIWVVLVELSIKNHIQFDIVRRLLHIWPCPFQFASRSNGTRNVDKCIANTCRGPCFNCFHAQFCEIGRAPKGNYYSNSNHPFPIASLFLVIFVQDLSHDDSMCDNDPYKMPHQLKGPITPLTVEKYMAQSLHIGFYGPFTNLPFLEAVPCILTIRYRVEQNFSETYYQAIYRGPITPFLPIL